jgi:hypothetical protein
VRQTACPVRARSLLRGGDESVIGADSTPTATIDRVLLDTGLAHLPSPEC